MTSSPCQDLTTAGASARTLGFVRKRSTAFHCVYFLFHLFKELGQLHRVFFAFENAVSMLYANKQHLQKIIGLQPVHAQLIDSGDWSYATRKRYWFTPATGIAKLLCTVERDTKDWAPLPILENGRPTNKNAKLGRWLTVQTRTIENPYWAMCENARSIQTQQAGLSSSIFRWNRRPNKINDNEQAAAICGGPPATEMP